MQVDTGAQFEVDSMAKENLPPNMPTTPNQGKNTNLAQNKANQRQ